METLITVYKRTGSDFHPGSFIRKFGNYFDRMTLYPGASEMYRAVAECIKISVNKYILHTPVIYPIINKILTCSIFCLIIVTEHIDVGSLSDSHLRNIGHQIAWYPIRMLSNIAGLMCTDRIEIAQTDHIPFGIRSTQILFGSIRKG